MSSLVLKRRLPRAWIWDGIGENPYLGMLALAEYIVVTEDSASMVSEAASTGKPVYVAAMDGGNASFDAFHGLLRTEGVTRPFDGIACIVELRANQRHATHRRGDSPPHRLEVTRAALPTRVTAPRPAADIAIVHQMSAPMKCA